MSQDLSPHGFLEKLVLGPPRRRKNKMRDIVACVLVSVGLQNEWGEDPGFTLPRENCYVARMIALLAPSVLLLHISTTLLCR